MIETPVVCVSVQRAGPATGVPTKTEQGDLWQLLGAGQGDYPRILVAPATQLDLFYTIPMLFNLVDKYQCPGLVLSDLLISEGTCSVDPAELDFKAEIHRGQTIFINGESNPFGGYNDVSYLRYLNTASGISPRAVPGVPGHIHVAATDEHDEDGTLISDEFTNPAKRRMMVEKRGRKTGTVLAALPPPRLAGPADARDLACRYAVQRAEAAFRLWPRLKSELEKEGLWDPYARLELPLLGTLARMEARGILLDQGFLRRFGQELEMGMQRLEREIYALAGEEFLIQSPQQLGRILFEKMKLTPQKKTRGKTALSTDVEVLQALEQESPIAAKVLEYRSMGKLKSTYVDALLKLADPATGRVHTTFLQ